MIDRSRGLGADTWPDVALPAPNRSRPDRRLSALLVAVVLVATAAIATARDQWPPAAAPGTRTAPATTGGNGSTGTGGLVTYATRAEFLTATAGMDLSFEDFSPGFTGHSAAVDCHQAVGSDSDDACFRPGDLVPGFAIRSSRGSIFSANGDSDIVSLGAGFLGTPTPVLGAYLADPPHNPTHITFEPDVVAVGMDLYDGLAGGSLSVTAYDADEAEIGSFLLVPTALNEPVFAGFTSSVPIDRVAINALTDGGAELLGDLHFGGRAGKLATLETETTFGVVAVGATASREVVLVNAGDLPLLPSLPAAPAPFHWLEDGCSGVELAGGASCSMTLAFTPPYAGQFRRGLDLSGDLPHALRPVLDGEGQVPRLTPAPGHVDFGTLAPGGSSAVETIDLANLTGGTIVVQAIASPPAPFVAEGGTCGTPPLALAPGDSCSLGYRFAPLTAGGFDATILISLDHGTTRASLSGHAEDAR